MILAWCLERSLYLVCLVACVLLAFSLASFLYLLLLIEPKAIRKVSQEDYTCVKK